jgi:ribosomal protein S18 acetylase RimI-like enzyme
MRRAETLLDEMGCPKLNLQVRTTTPDVVGFYESLGFQVEERISMGKVLSGGAARSQSAIGDVPGDNSNLAKPRS